MYANAREFVFAFMRVHSRPQNHALDGPRQSLGRQLRALAALAAASAGLAAAEIAPGGYFVPGDPKAGMQAFLEKGCSRCHSVFGEGGRSAPDLARVPAGHLSAGEVVSAMWNHAPAMWQRMQQEHLNPPKFSDQEMTNLFAFLYSVRSLDEPGDPERGRRLLAERRCLDCHAVGGGGAGKAPDLKSWTAYRNPVTWIQAMWNHGQAMQKMMAARGLAWPQFQETEMSDVISYIRTLGGGTHAHAYLRLANAGNGRRVFEGKGCASCHAIRGMGGRRAPDLGTRALPRTLGQFAAMMWNHGPAMWTSMQAQRIERPSFSNQEMADLIAYLFTERYFEAAGNADRGRRIWADKGCASCHTGSPGAGAPDLAGWRANASAVRIAAALWNHGPLMLGSMAQKQIPWPRFRSGEINDLMEYLNRGLPPIERAGGRP